LDIFGDRRRGRGRRAKRRGFGGSERGVTRGDVADADARARAVSDPRGTLRRASTPRSKTPDRRRFAREKVQGRIGRRGKAHHVLPEGRASDQRGLRLRG
jgi:hypothetical protein